MDVKDMLSKFYGNEIYFTAKWMNEKETERQITEYQKLWDEGNAFARDSVDAFKYFSYPTPKRAEDTEEEMAGCAKEIQTSLKNIIRDTWISKYSRKEMDVLCGLLFKSLMERHIRVRLVADLEIGLSEMVWRWNDLHPEEEAIFLHDPHIG